MKHLKLFFALFAMLALGVTNAWGAEETITFEYDGSDVITENTYSTTYAFHRWTATSSDGTIIYAGGKTSNANGGSAWGLRYANTRVGEVIGNIEPSYDASASWKTNIPSGAVGAIPGNIKQIKVFFHNATSGTRGCYILVSKNQIYADDLVPNTTPSGATKSSKLTSNDYAATPASQTYETSDGYKYFGVVSANSSFIGVKKIVVTYETSGSGETPETPAASLTANPTSLDFGNVTQNNEVEAKTFTISGSDFTTGELTITAPSGYTVNPTTVPVNGTLEETTITVTPETSIVGPFNGNVTISGANLKSSVTVALTMTVEKAPATPTENVYVKVTSTEGITDGEYLIVYEDASNEIPAPVAFDGSLATLDAVSNNIAVTITDGTIAGNTDIDAATFTIDNTAGTLKSASGYYIGVTTYGNALKQNTVASTYGKHSFVISEGNAIVKLSNESWEGDMTLRYNSSSNNGYRFRYYKSGQQPIALYKKTDGQQVAGLAYETTKYLTKLGETFATPVLANPNSVDVTYESSDNNVATVAVDGAVTINAAGIATITASFAGNSSFLEGSAKYTICVTEHAGTEADPYTVADARRVIDVMGTATDVYATGIVSEIVTAYSSEHGDITYNISVDGQTTSDQLQAYRGKAKDGENFTSADDIKLGDEVVVKGNLLKYSSTYEFNAGNQLVSLNRTKQQAGLAYEETELTANVGEDFAEPTLTNPNNLTITYSSSNTALATVNATTGEVTIIAAGKVTITASSVADVTYAAGNASYNITITDPSLAIATLPFYFDGKRADIEGTAGMTHEGIDSDYSDAPYLKFNTTGDWAIVQFDSEPGEFSFLLEQNGETIGTFTVYESENGEDYTPIWSGGDLGGNAKSATIEPTLSATARYVKFEYTTKPTGTNYGLGEISIKKADHRQEAGLAWNPETVTLTVGDAFTAPTFSNPNSVTGIEFTSSNSELATVNNAGVISLVSGKTGTATITATFAGDATYKAAEVTCTITVDHKSEDIVILAKCKDQYYALVAEYVEGKTDVLQALPVEYVGGKIYNVETEDQASIIWKRSVVDGKTTFKNGENYLSAVNSAALQLATEACEWVFEGDMYKVEEGSTRTILYYTSTGGFKNYSTSNMSNDGVNGEYSSAAITVAPVFADGDAYHRTVTSGNYGTICIPYGSSNYKGAEFYEVAWVKMNEESMPTTLYLDQLEAGATLEAGKPYIFKATATEIAIIGDGTSVATPIAGINGLKGTFENITAGGLLVDNYIIAQNQFWTATAENYLNAYRAYIVPSSIPTTEPAEIPGRRRIAMGAAGENEATGLDNITTTDTPVKVIVNGQLIIIREGVKYNVQGQKL